MELAVWPLSPGLLVQEAGLLCVLGHVTLFSSAYPVGRFHKLLTVVSGLKREWGKNKMGEENALRTSPAVLATSISYQSLLCDKLERKDLNSTEFLLFFPLQGKILWVPLVLLHLTG